MGLSSCLDSQEPSVVLSLWDWTLKTALSARTVSQSRYGGLKRTNREQVGRLVYPTAQTLKPAPFEMFNRGWNWQPSARDRYSVRSVGTGKYRRDACPVSTWRES